MDIGILSFRALGGPIAKEERRLKQAAQAKGHKARVFRSMHCQLVYDQKGERVFLKGKRFPKLDVLIPRASFLNHVELRLALVEQFELMGVPVLNHASSIAKAKNKLRTMQILHALGIPTLKTVVIDSYEILDRAIDMVGGAPVIIKDPFGSFGSGVMIAESKRAVRSTLDAIWQGKSRSFMLQEFVEESGGKDTRVFVVGGKVIASMERQAQEGEFRSNAELGGLTQAVEVDPAFAEVALAATEALGLDVAGVDVIQTKKGPAILEVNANPGFKSLEEATGVDVAGAIIDHAVSKFLRS